MFCSSSNANLICLHTSTLVGCSWTVKLRDKLHQRAAENIKQEGPRTSAPSALFYIEMLANEAMLRASALLQAPLCADLPVL